MRTCEHCGWPLHFFEGEFFCPDCTRFTVLEPDDDGPCQFRLIPDGPDHVRDDDLPPW